MVGLLEKSFFVPFHFNITLINFIILYKIWLLKNIMKDSGFIISMRSVTNGLKSGEFLFYNNSFCFVTAVYSSFLVTLLALVFRKKAKEFSIFASITSFIGEGKKGTFTYVQYKNIG